MAKRSSLTLRFNALLVSGLSVLFVGACTSLKETPQTIFDPKGPVANAQMQLHILIAVLSLIVFIGVEGLILYFALRYRRRGEATMPSQVHGNTRLEIAWSAVPVLILIVMGIPTIKLIGDSAEPPTDRGAPLPVTVIGHQWWWEFVYPTLNITTGNEMHLPTGRPIVMTLESKDVIHSFWIPAFGGKMDAIPTRGNTMWFIADVPGEYYGQCMEFCGTNHALMRQRAIADTPADFDTWVKAQQSPGVPASGDAVVRGQQLFRAASCATCHTVEGHSVEGLKFQGKIGPNLTHFASRTTIAAGVLPHTPEGLKTWLEDPDKVKPGNDMKIRKLSEAEIGDLTAYLFSLK